LQSAAYHASPFVLVCDPLLFVPKFFFVGLVVAYSSHIFCSPQLLDGIKTAMTRLHETLLNKGDEIAMSARQQSPLIWRCNLLDDDDGGASAISSNS
jgi:hypothetical protein